MILALETSTRNASLAVWDRATGDVVHEATFTTERAHNAVIFGPVEAILTEYRERLRGIVVGLGPGSYGGVRVAIAVANGLGLAMGLPVAGRSSLEAWDAEDDSYLVVGDARRGTFFVAEVIDRRLRGEPALIDVAEIEAHLAPLRERGLPLHTSDPKVAERLPGARLSTPSAGKLAALFGDRDFESGPVVLEPHYLRAPFITTPKQPRST
ncbi:MAG: tRNA (adenosine(37)-N6)-threonylcarbamoyltransferase complex dimerization subunit type 1 TsaB [Verrucomicrobiaceae bacterium]|nr:tRNA (adenosine(37)-N6)-threonylcarbamoyltransferase complex dimerization subunit type 1 TsaB [Verrucomicrobiaceae bacterium]